MSKKCEKGISRAEPFGGGGGGGDKRVIIYKCTSSGDNNNYYARLCLLAYSPQDTRKPLGHACPYMVVSSLTLT